MGYREKEMAIVNYMRFDDSEIGLMDSECRTWTTIRDYIAIPMQYTGLHDKNGKEIYEGDICIVSLSYFKIKDEKATVIFHNGAFQFQYGCEKFFSKPHDAWDEVEVIGNIHDNPELLEVSE